VRPRRLGFGLFLSATAGVILGHAWTAAKGTWWWIGALTLLSGVLLVLSGLHIRLSGARSAPREEALPHRGVIARWPRPTLGEVLVDRYGIITAEQLQAGLDRQVKEGGRLGDILLDMGVIASSDLEAALREQQPAEPSETTPVAR
jgi:hypothetical protein